jgi:hypothetical protein
MSEKEQKQAVEVLINVAIMNVANEQAEMIKGLFKHKAKQDFNLWLKQGNKLMKMLKETFNDDQKLMLDNMTDVYHEQKTNKKQL